MLDAADGTMLNPVDVIGNVLSVQAGVVMHDVIVILECIDEPTAQEVLPLVVCPVRVGVVSKEVCPHLGIVLGDVLLSLTELMHAGLVLVQAVRMLVEQGRVLQVLEVDEGCVNQRLRESAGSSRRKCDSKLHVLLIY